MCASGFYVCIPSLHTWCWWPVFSVHLLTFHFQRILLKEIPSSSLSSFYSNLHHKYKYCILPFLSTFLYISFFKTVLCHCIFCFQTRRHFPHLYFCPFALWSEYLCSFHTCHVLLPAVNYKVFRVLLPWGERWFLDLTVVVHIWHLKQSWWLEVAQMKFKINSFRFLIV